MAINIATRMTGMAAATSMFRQLNSKLSGGRSTWVVGSDVEYAGFVEHGTRYMAPQPYMRPAAQRVQADVGRHVRSAPNLDAAVQSAAYAVEAEAKRNCPVRTGRLRSSIAARKT